MSPLSLMRVALAALIVALTPVIVFAQSSQQTVCKDGTTSKLTGAGACDGHGGVDDLKTAMARRKRILMGEPKQDGGAASTSTSTTAATDAPAPVPADAPARERASGKSRAPSALGDGEARRPKHAVARCRDGTYDHGRGKKRKNVCKHHGGIGRWYGH